MASIASLLNPLPDEYSVAAKCRQLPSPCSTAYTRDFTSPPPPPPAKKQKVSKDAAVFTKGKTKGELRYPPCEYQNAEIGSAHRAFELHPMGHITEYPRHIPYNSEKKSFMEKTGRESFEGRVEFKEMRPLADLFSLPVHLQDAWRRARVHCDVGLQHWSRQNDFFIPMQSVLQGRRRLSFWMFRC